MPHPGIKASLRIMMTRSFWPNIEKDNRLWTQTCHQCQSSKINQHTKQPIIPLEIPSQQFKTIHIDIV